MSFPKPEYVEHEYDGCLRVKYYAIKYGLSTSTVTHWCKKNYLDASRRPWKHHTRGEMFVWYVIDKHPDKHPNFTKNMPLNKRLPYRKGSGGDRRSILAKYLPVFQEYSSPDKTKFRRADIANILNVTPNNIQTWELWGLPKTSFTGNKKIWAYDWYFSREDIIDFLDGNWDELRARHKKMSIENTGSTEEPAYTPVKTYSEGESSENEGYYVYQEDKVFPKGYEGFMAWIKEMGVQREDRRQRKFVQVDFLPMQKEFFFNALKLKPDGDYRYQYICTSRPRGDCKSFDVKLLMLFRFFNMFRETILTAANSKEQSTFVQFDEARETIEKTERLRNTPGLDIKEKGIYLYEGKKQIASQIIPIASKHGLLPNVTCIVFTEICELRNEPFYSQLTGSIRGVPNAMILIDSTVAPRGHIFHRLHKAYESGKAPLVYFQHYEDKHFNPEITPEFLQQQELTLLPTEFAKYFRNRWEDAAGGVFSGAAIIEMGYAGLKGQSIGPSDSLRKSVEKIVELEKRSSDATDQSLDLNARAAQSDDIRSSLTVMTDFYKIPSELEGLERIKSSLDCDLIFGVGVDRANTLSVSNDRTAMALTARAVITESLSYYFLVDIDVAKRDATLPYLTTKISRWLEVFGWIDKVAIEEYQGNDLFIWCENQGLESELIHPSQRLQMGVFSNFCMLMRMGYFKAAPVPFYVDDSSELHRGYKQGKDDVFREELANFMHDPDKRFFGSPDKRKKGGIKDDTIYGVGYSIYATQGEQTALTGGGSGGTDSFSGAIEDKSGYVGVYD